MRIAKTKQYAYRPIKVVNDKDGYETIDYDEKCLVSANIVSYSIESQARVFGNTDKDMHLMLTNEELDYKKGDGVCVYVDVDLQPDYEVLTVQKKGHYIIMLQKIAWK